MAGKHQGDSEDGPRPDGRQARWAQHNADRRARIVEAALAVIDAHEPGSELHVQQIAAEAGLSRTVIYRHFEDRTDLDHAIQQRILDDVWAQLKPAVTLDGTVPEVIERIVGTYVRWAVAHPSLHRMADYDSEPGGPLEKALEEIAAQVTSLVGTVMLGLGPAISEEDAAALDPLVHGIVGAVFGAVRRWVARPDPTLTAEGLISLTSRSVWFVLDGHARDLGVQIDPRRNLEELLGATLGG
jgi:AcrR family transcriptional regulator